MELDVRREADPDFHATASLATEAFGAGFPPFSAGRLAWLYGRAFGRPTIVLALFSDTRKVGQVALVGQTLEVGGRLEHAVALVDLFILPAFRSREAIATLYQAVERHCAEEGVRVLLAVPNKRAVGVNRRFLQLATAATLDIRVGLMPFGGASRLRASALSASFEREAGIALLSRYLPSRGTGLAWTADTLWNRLQDPSAQFGLHASDDLLLVSSRRRRRRMSFSLLCGFFARPGTVVDRPQVRAVTAAACRLHRQPLFVYVGQNPTVPLPGWSLPDRLRPSLMIVQARDLAAGSAPVDLERFELLDFDFA